MILSSYFSISNKSEGVQTAIGFFLRGVTPSLTAYYLIRNTETPRKNETAFATLAAAIAITALYEPLTGHHFLFRREYVHHFPMEIWPPEYGFAVGAVGQPLPLGILLNILLPFSLCLWGKIRKSLYFVLNALIVCGILMTFRRSAYALLILNILFMASRTGNIGRKTVLRLLFGVLILFSAIAALPGARAKLTRFSPNALAAELTHLHRRKAYGVAMRMAADHPLFGIGTRQYLQHYQRYADYPDPDNSPDSQYLRFLAEGGLLGLGVFLLFIGYVLKRIWTNMNTPNLLPYISSITAFAMAMFVNDSLYWPALQMTSLVIIGSAMALADR
jgi:O-antigen ligase